MKAEEGKNKKSRSVLENKGAFVKKEKSTYISKYLNVLYIINIYLALSRCIWAISFYAFSQNIS